MTQTEGMKQAPDAETYCKLAAAEVGRAHVDDIARLQDYLAEQVADACADLSPWRNSKNGVALPPAVLTPGDFKNRIRTLKHVAQEISGICDRIRERQREMITLDAIRSRLG
jgi:hypothetical protein